MLCALHEALSGAALFLLFNVVLGAIAFASTACTALTGIPALGTMVRIRANYLPKGVALDESGKVGPAVYSVRDMKHRVKQLEGRRSLWRGASLLLYYGAALALAYVVVLTAIMIPYALVTGGHFMISVVLNFAVLFVIAALLMPPMVALMCRTMVHPHGLDWRQPRACLRELMTDDELENPWLLYMIPDVLPTMAFLLLCRLAPAMQMAHVIIQVITAAHLGLTFVRDVVFTLILIFLVILLTPLDCALVRLMVQRPMPAAEPPTAESPEPVIELRPHAESTPAYTGIADCLRKMVAEEGTESIWRGSFIHAHVLQ